MGVCDFFLDVDCGAIPTLFRSIHKFKSQFALINELYYMYLGQCAAMISKYSNMNSKISHVIALQYTI